MMCDATHIAISGYKSGNELQDSRQLMARKF